MADPITPPPPGLGQSGSNPGVPAQTQTGTGSKPGLPNPASNPGLSKPGTNPGLARPGTNPGHSKPGVPHAGASGQVQTNEDGLPRRFGKYTLLRVLAKGGMAELFLAIQKSVAGFEKLIVIKRILPSMNQDKAFIEMLLHEARIAATLSHPNIVQIFDVGQAEGLYFIAMEHVHGEDIRSIVRGMKVKSVPEFPLEHALAIAIGMCAGLAYAHDKRDLDNSPLGIVHRDISPQNVVVTFSGDVKIVDFGIAKSDNKSQTETKSGKLKGKVPYMSPEQARGEVIDARSDIFATGVMLFELTTGKRLFKGSSEFETLKLICERDYPKPSQVRPGYPPELERIVMKSLAKDVNERYQNAREMQGDLETFVRNNRIAVSNIALSQFMQGLFEDKLQSQKEALIQGKALADIIAQQDPQPSELDMSQALLSTPAAAHTLTDVPARRGGMVFGAVAAFVLIAAGIGGTVYVMKQKQARNTVGGPVNPPVAVAKGSLEITTDPPGAAIWIDGDLRPESTPATIAQLPTSGRVLDVKLSKEGYESEKQAVTLTDASPKGTLKVTLKRGSVVIDLTVLPSSVTSPTVALDGKKYAMTTIDGIASGDQHKLVVSAPGFVDWETKFIGQPQEKKHFDVTLTKASTGGGTGVHVENISAKGSGKLNVGASGGWCNVSVDGAPKGPTPLAGVELSSGAHKVTCTTGEGKTLSTVVNVPIDGTARYKFTL